MGAAIHRTIAPSRITFVDTAKGISILLIVALHANFHPEMLAFVELPLFFILSGIFYSTKLDFKHFLIKKLYTLLWPCLIWQLPSWIYSITYYFLHKEISLIICFKDSPVPTTVWFLWSLFLIQIALYPIVKYKKKWLLPLAIMSYIIGYKLGIMNIYNFLFIPTSLTCLIYFTIGYMCKEIIKKFDKFRTDIIVAVTLMGGGIFLWSILYIVTLLLFL